MTPRYRPEHSVATSTFQENGCRLGRLHRRNAARLARRPQTADTDWRNRLDGTTLCATEQRQPAFSWLGIFYSFVAKSPTTFVPDGRSISSSHPVVS